MNISVLGDSISTYEGYNPIGNNVFYNLERIYDYGLSNVNDTWWMRVIQELKGKLCVNNSFSGSTVFDFNEYSMSAKERCQKLHTTDSEPDVILVYAGTNDCLGKVPVEDFYNDYVKMLKRIKERYDNAKIFCSTLTIGSFKESDMPKPVYSYLKKYSEAISKACSEQNVYLIDLLSYKKLYSANDNAHPNKDGHALIAKQWLEEIKKHIQF